MLDLIPAAGAGRHNVLAKAAEAACRESDRDLLHVIMLLALTPNKATSR